MTATLKVAVGFLLLHGATALGYALWVGRSTQWANDPTVSRAVTRLAIILILSWGLSTRQGWAWWLTLIGSAAGAVTGALTYSALWRGTGDPSLFGPLQMVVGLVIVGSLAVVFLLLLLPSGRGNP